MILPLLIEKLKTEEGFREKPYQDTLGVWTFGYGFTFITEDEARAVLEIKAERAASDAADLFSCWDDLSATRQRVLAEIVFQIGKAGLSRFSRFRAAVESHDHEKAALELLDSLAAKQTPERWKRHTEDWKTG
jgi:lysozyme